MTYLFGIEDGPSQKREPESEWVVQVPSGMGRGFECPRRMNADNERRVWNNIVKKDWSQRVNE